MGQKTKWKYFRLITSVTARRTEAEHVISNEFCVFTHSAPMLDNPSVPSRALQHVITIRLIRYGSMPRTSISQERFKLGHSL